MAVILICINWALCKLGGRSGGKKILLAKRDPSKSEIMVAVRGRKEHGMGPQLGGRPC